MLPGKKSGLLLGGGLRKPTECPGRRQTKYRELRPVTRQLQVTVGTCLQGYASWHHRSTNTRGDDDVVQLVRALQGIVRQG